MSIGFSPLCCLRLRPPGGFRGFGFTLGLQFRFASFDFFGIALWAEFAEFFKPTLLVDGG